MPSAEEMLAMLRRGGCIVSTGDSSPAEIAQARVCGRLHVDARGFGYVYRPPVRCDGPWRSSQGQESAHAKTG